MDEPRLDHEFLAGINHEDIEDSEPEDAPEVRGLSNLPGPPTSVQTPEKDSGMYAGCALSIE